MSEPIKIAAVSGSIRHGSYNTGLVRALQQIAEKRDSVSITIVEGIADLPYVNGALLANGIPEPVQRAHAAISGADAVIFATPEYSYTMPGVLKNFIDWQALPVPQANPLGYKPVGILGASIGKFGTYRAQAELRKALQFTDSQVLTKPEVYVSYSGDKFDVFRS